MESVLVDDAFVLVNYLAETAHLILLGPLTQGLHNQADVAQCCPFNVTSTRHHLRQVNEIELLLLGQDWERAQFHQHGLKLSGVSSAGDLSTCETH